MGCDIPTFESSIISGASGVFSLLLSEDAGIVTDLVIRPGQRVSVSGDASLPRPPRWGGGSFEMQQRGSLSMSFVEVSGAISVSGGSLSLAHMAASADVVFHAFLTATTSSVLRVSEVSVDYWQDLGPLTGSATVGADGVPVYDPPDLLPAPEVRLSRTFSHLQARTGAPSLLAISHFVGKLLKLAWACVFG